MPARRIEHHFGIGKGSERVSAVRGPAWLPNGIGIPWLVELNLSMSL